MSLDTKDFFVKQISHLFKGVVFKFSNERCTKVVLKVKFSLQNIKITMLLSVCKQNLKSMHV